MLGKHFKFMFLVIFHMILSEKIMSSESSLPNNNQLVVYQLDLRPSERYSGVSYDVNRKETDDEKMLYYTTMSSVFGRRLQNNVTSLQGAEKNSLFITMPEVISASSLSIISEENDNDSDGDNQDLMVTQAWSENVNVSVFFDDNINELSNSISNLRSSSSLHLLYQNSDVDFESTSFKSVSSKNSDSSLDSKYISEFKDNDFGINSSGMQNVF